MHSENFSYCNLEITSLEIKELFQRPEYLWLLQGLKIINLSPSCILHCLQYYVWPTMCLKALSEANDQILRSSSIAANIIVPCS